MKKILLSSIVTISSLFAYAADTDSTIHFNLPDTSVQRQNIYIPPEPVNKRMADRVTPLQNR